MPTVLQSLVKIKVNTGECDKYLGVGFYFKTKDIEGIFTAAHVVKNQEITNLIFVKHNNEKETLDIKPNHAKYSDYDGVILLFSQIITLRDFFDAPFLEPLYEYSPDINKFAVLNAIANEATDVNWIDSLNEAHYGKIVLIGKNIKDGYSAHQLF